MNPEVVLDIKCKLGEGPLWHPLEKKLYWLDILEGIIYRYDPETGMVEEVYRGDTVGGYTIQEDGSLLLFMEKGVVKLWKDKKLIPLIDEFPQLKDTRFNDVIADPAGRVFCGTMPNKAGKAFLFRLDTDKVQNLIFDSVALSNGMGFTPDKKKMYFTDSKKSEIYIFDYNMENGSLSNRRLFLKVEEKGMVPDGMTVDAEGYVWSAFWNGSCIKRFNPEGKEVLKVIFPARKITCMTFGGADYRDMYITSAGGSKRPEEGTGAGSLFRLNTGIQGLPEHLSRICF